MVTTSFVVATSFAQCSFRVDVVTSVTCHDIIFRLRPPCYLHDVFMLRLRFLGRNCVGGLLVFITFNFMSPPHGDVATSLSSAQLFFKSRPQFHVATDFFLFNYFPGRDIKVMSRHPFLRLSSS